MQSQKQLTISVIIPVYNGGIDFHTCLSHLAVADPQPLEVIVVADGDTDGSRLFAHQFGAKVIELPTPQGPAHARNLGAKVAQGDLLLFIDADVAIQPGTIGKALSCFQEKPGSALIGSYDDAPGCPNFLSQYRNLLHHYTHQNGSETAFTFWGACGVICRDVFLSLGGFNDGYRYPSIEDIELGSRLIEAGYKIRLCKDLQVKHLKKWEAVSIIQTDFFKRALPWTELILRQKKFTNDLNLQTSSRLSVMVACSILLLILSIPFWGNALPATILLIGFLLTLNAGLYRYNWIYIHAPEVRVGRIQNFKNWSPEMVPDPQKTCLGMEYFCSQGDDLWEMADEDLIALATEELAKLGLTKGADVEDGVVIRQLKAYPVYDGEYRQHLDVIQEFLGDFENLQTIGRNGMHRYNNQDHSMLTGMLAIENLMGGTHDLWDVNTERSYHEEFTVKSEPAKVAVK